MKLFTRRRPPRPYTMIRNVCPSCGGMSYLPTWPPAPLFLPDHPPAWIYELREICRWCR